MKNSAQSVENNYLPVSENIRLRPTSLEDVTMALAWYKDMEILKYTAGVDRTTPYDEKTVKSMYRYLMKIGECYIIEVKEDEQWLGIGDVTLSKETIPIVIGRKEYWGCGIGKRVLIYLIQRAREIGYSKIKVKEILL